MQWQMWKNCSKMPLSTGAMNIKVVSTSCETSWTESLCIVDWTVDLGHCYFHKTILRGPVRLHLQYSIKDTSSNSSIFESLNLISRARGHNILGPIMPQYLQYIVWHYCYIRILSCWSTDFILRTRCMESWKLM
jgi:hypothetical protein